MSQFKVLIVDDLDSNRAILSRCVSRAGYCAQTAQDGRQALERIAAEPPDLVLLDWTMPGMSGVEILKVIRATYSADQLPVIMCTARADSRDMQAALGLGANDYITKPISVPMTISRIEAQLRRRQASQELDALQGDLGQGAKRALAASPFQDSGSERIKLVDEILRLTDWLEHSKDAGDETMRRMCASSIAAAVRMLARTN